MASHHLTHTGRFLSRLTAAAILGLAMLVISGYSAGAAPPTLPTTVCIVDDSNGNQLQFDKNTGAYTFTNCTGFTVTGTGKVTIKGSIITLTHVASDRRLYVLVDQSVKKANASLMIIPAGVIRTIIDRNTANDVCACGDDDDEFVD
ncbi:MAG TPA: hypothetical protein VLM38_10800 [Blastocatellia bacterium]|nr:hypothetical protein [Blastocatellia bacterium]